MEVVVENWPLLASCGLGWSNAEKEITQCYWETQWYGERENDFGSVWICTATIYEKPFDKSQLFTETLTWTK